MRPVEPDSPAALKRYQALKRRWSRAGLAARVAAVSLALGSLGGIGAGTYVAAESIPQNVTILSGPVAQVDTPLPSDTPTDTPLPTEAPTEAPTPAPTEAPTSAPAAQPALPPVPTAVPATGATPIPLPTEGVTLWAGTGTGTYTTPSFAMPTGVASVTWSYRCSASSGDFEIRGYEDATGDSTGGTGAIGAVEYAGLSSFSAHGPGHVVITAGATCTWSVTVTD